MHYPKFLCREPLCDLPLRMHLRGLRIRLTCRLRGHDLKLVPSYHIAATGEAFVVGWRYRCQRCNTDHGWKK